MKGKWKTNKVFISTRWNEKKEKQKKPSYKEMKCIQNKMKNK